MKLACRIAGPNCKGAMTTSEPVAANATYTCSECNHKPSQTVFYDPYGHANPVGRRKRQAKKTNDFFREQYEVEGK